jgi:hypothetical protein
MVARPNLACAMGKWDKEERYSVAHFEPSKGTSGLYAKL